MLPRVNVPRHINRFVVVGGINTVVYYPLYLLLRTVVPYLAAHLFAIFIAMVGSFFLNCYWTFQTRPTWRKFALFPLTNATSYVLTTLGVIMLVEWFGVDERVAPLVAALAAIPVTFVLSRRVLTSPHGSAQVATSTRRLQRAPEWVVALSVAVVAMVLCVIPQWRGTFFYYVGDQHEQFLPLWHHFGEQLRSGHWPTMEPDGWMGGNYAAEALTGIWNPVNLVNFVVVSFFNNLSVAAFTVMIEILGLLALATFLLAREYGARRAPSAVVATALPVSGFTLWYDASGWPAALMALTWVAYFWWAARRHSRGLLNPFVPFVFGYLAITTGNPYATLGLVIVLVAIAVELVLQREFARLAHLTVMGGCVGAVALLVFLPLLGASDVTSRQQLAQIANDTFFVPDLGDLAAASSPTYLPSILNWNGALLEHVPSTYCAWFALPLLPWLQWRSLQGRLRSLTSLFVVAGVYLTATLGPSNLWLFRWPLRLIEYFYLAACVLFAVVLSAGLATNQVRQRAMATGAIVLAGTYLAWAVEPQHYNRIHLAGLALMAALLTTGLLAYLRRGLWALGIVLIAGTASVVTLQTSVFQHATAADPPVYPAYDVARLKANTRDYQGTVLQLASLTGVTTEQLRTGEIMFGNLPRAAGLVTIGSYTGMGFVKFGNALCMDYRGATCPLAFDRLWQPADHETNAPLVDAMRVSTLVLQRSLLPDVADRTPPPGWRVADKNNVRTVWLRDHPLAGEGRVSWSSGGVYVLTDSAQPQREIVRYHSSEEAGRILFARLDWPGYLATLDSHPIEVVNGPVGLVAVEVPRGEHVLTLEFDNPGLRLGILALGTSAAVIVLQTMFWITLRRRRR